MDRTHSSLTGLLLTGLLAMPAAHAESLASSASSASSASVASLSDSVNGSSNSSTTPAKVAAGDYRIDAITESADQPGMLRLTLVGQDDAGFVLVLPQRTYEQQALARGDLVHVQLRPYGIEFARADNRQAFFLALSDEWMRELDARAVKL